MVQHLVSRDLGVGVSLRSVHFAHVLEHRPSVDFFEILSDNFMHTGGRPLRVLDAVAEQYPIVMHGVGLDIGGVDPLDRDYLRELASLQRRCAALWVSDHLCWTGVGGTRLHDLMPMPYTEEALHHLVARIHTVQDALGQPLVLENPSTYLQFADADFDEPAFLAALTEATGCGLLLDVNNVWVAACNHGFDAADHLRRVPWDRVVQLHVAGHAVHETHRLDTHDRPVCADVWELLALGHRLGGARSTVLEWDAAIPGFDVVHDEARKALRSRGGLAVA